MDKLFDLATAAASLPVMDEDKQDNSKSDATNTNNDSGTQTDCQTSENETEHEEDNVKTKDKKSFPMQLMEVLSKVEDNGISRIMNWLPHGKSFMIFKIKSFTRKVLPKYFQLKNFASFRRKLNRWGFKHVMRGPDAGAVFHKLFERSQPDLCATMKCQRTGIVREARDIQDDQAVYESLVGRSRTNGTTNGVTPTVSGMNGINAVVSGTPDCPQGAPTSGRAPRRVSDGTVKSNEEPSVPVPNNGAMPRRVTMEMSQGAMPRRSTMDMNATNVLMQSAPVLQPRQRRATMDMVLGGKEVPHSPDQDPAATFELMSRLSAIADGSGAQRRTTMDMVDSMSRLTTNSRRPTMDMSDNNITPNPAPVTQRLSLDMIVQGMAREAMNVQPADNGRRRATMDMLEEISKQTTRPSTAELLEALQKQNRQQQGQQQVANLISPNNAAMDMKGGYTSAMPRRSTMDMFSSTTTQGTMMGRAATEIHSNTKNMFDPTKHKVSASTTPNSPTLTATNPKRRATMDMHSSNIDGVSVAGQIETLKRASMDMYSSSTTSGNSPSPLLNRATMNAVTAITEQKNRNRLIFEKRQKLIDMLQQEQAKQIAEDFIMAREIYTTPSNAGRRDERSQIIEAALDAAHRSGMQPKSFY
eukprot:CAMPEP_0172522610 /NCGR_PEP_ID=MMETSP1066-20121228/293220_1 /TAXON_ID=671091 /ORGANISM="Coscinodiscus wailesii, Strain CCMP2513" /LENGTH=641 /DNA_ID=CAMNT_0013305631 /DNA_START=115 /DNA_END=2040 /DNA_ORIENTATION=-